MPSEKVASALSRLGVEVPVSEFSHFGVPGMKWGVRREDSNGDGVVGDEGSGGSGGKSPGGGTYGQRPSTDRIIEKGFVSTDPGGGMTSAGGAAGGEETDEYMDDLTAILGNDDLSDDEKQKAIAALQTGYLTKLSKKGVPILDKNGKEISVKDAVAGKTWGQAAPKAPKDFIKEAQRNVDQFVKSSQKNVGNVVKDTQKNVGNIVKDTQKNVDKAVKDTQKNVKSLVDDIFKKANGG